MMMYIIVVALVIHGSFYAIVFSRLARYQEEYPKSKKEDISIVICYHNEAQNIPDTVPKIESQTFNELILVDDNSIDQTLSLLEKYQNESIQVIAIKKETLGKKYALSRGIDAANHDHILLTDADCIPSSDEWSRHMSSKQAAFVLGYGPMMRLKGLVATFSRYETYLTAIQYLSYALIGKPYMGVGRNLRISKKMFAENQDKIQGRNLMSGDDDLLINALADGQNTKICIHPESFMYSRPQNTWPTFFRQKSRHISTSTHYKLEHQVLLTLFSGSQILFYLAIIFAIFTGTISLKLALILILCKWLVQQAVNVAIMKKLREFDLIWKFPFLDIIHFIYLLAMPIYLLFNKNTSRWN